MKVAFQMQDMADTSPDDTNALILIQEANRRGHQVYHYQPETVSLDNTGIYAPCAPVTVDVSKEDYYQIGTHEKMDLSGFDVIWFRQDPPFDMAYVTNTFILERLTAAGVLIVNNPYWIRNMPDKLSIFDFPDYLPPTLVSRDVSEIQRFLDEHKDVVVKPLYSFFGHGIIRTSDIDDIQTELSNYVEPLMFQPYLKDIKDGNKRLVFFDGEFVGAIKTINQDTQEFRVYRDSIDSAYQLTLDEEQFCRRVKPILQDRDLVFVGIDFVGPYLLEINTGSVGSLMRMNSVYNDQFEQKLWEVVENKHQLKFT